MSSKKSSINGEGLLSTPGVRTPLRGLENDMYRLTTSSSKLKSRSLPHREDIKMTNSDVLFCDPDNNVHYFSSSKEIGTTYLKPNDNLPATDTIPKERACELGDITFKSFICTGGEVKISSPLEVAEDSIILPKGQATENTAKIEDTTISDSMVVHLCSDHVEHPYYDAASVSIDTASFCEFSNMKSVSENLDDDNVLQNSRASQSALCREKDITLKSLICDGGQLEFADITTLSDEIVPLPKAEFDDCLPYHIVNLSPGEDACVEQCGEERVDHPYCNRKSDMASSFTESPKSVNGLSDVTFKSFVCTGGEIEISGGTRNPDGTVLSLISQFVNSSGLYDNSMNLSILGFESHLQSGNDHADHPYCNMKNDLSPSSGDLSFVQEPLPCNLCSSDEVEKNSQVDVEAERQDITSFVCPGGKVELSGDSSLSETVQLPMDNAVVCEISHDNSVPPSIMESFIQNNFERPYCHVESNEVVSTALLSNVSIKVENDVDVNCQSQQTLNSSDCKKSEALPMDVQGQPECNTSVHSRNRDLVSSRAKDSNLGLSGDGTILSDSVKKPHSRDFSDVLTELPEFQAGTNALKLKLQSAIARQTPLARIRAHRDSSLVQFLAEDSALDEERSLTHVNPVFSGHLMELLESPMSQPLFNSTTLDSLYSSKPQTASVREPAEDVDKKPCDLPPSEAEKEVLDVPLLSNGPLQQQLRQMAEVLILASEKMGNGIHSVAATRADAEAGTSAESHSVCVGTTLAKLIDHSVNTSGEFERKRDVSVMDSCTVTDPLLWNLPPGSLECLSRQELEQRLRSSMIMVEALVQQLAAAQSQSCLSAGPALSDLREKLVQTDHTELNQSTTYRDLYVTALDRIHELELDNDSLQNLTQCMQDTKTTMTALSCDTDAALLNMKKIEDIVREDQCSLVSQYGRMKTMCETFKETQTRMVQKVRDTIGEREYMKQQMEEAITAKEAAFSVMEQLRVHSAMQISHLEENVGSHQELMAALTKAYPQQVAINKVYVESLSSASELLTRASSDQASLAEELQTVWCLLQKTAPILLKLNEKTAAALRERDRHLTEREQAAKENEQLQEELNQANLSLQEARQQIADLNLQLTIMNSEMGVLRQKFMEGEEERTLLEKKVVELSATVSSTLASYNFLEQALGAETTKLQQSWKEVQQANEKAEELEASLDQSQQHVCDLSQALAHSKEQLRQLWDRDHTQSLQIQQLQDVCTQLRSQQEMSEFLQMENELAREQVVESEHTLRANLEGLRERNIQCEDLKEALTQLQIEKGALQEELEATRAQANATQLNLGEQLAQVVTDITLLHHTLRGLTNELHATLIDKKPESSSKTGSQPPLSFERRHPSSSFVDSVIVALTAEKSEVAETETPNDQVSSDMPEPQCEGLFSETSAFNRITPVTPKKRDNVEDTPPVTPKKRGNVEEADLGDQSNMAELLEDLGNTVSELVSTLKMVQQNKDTEVEELRRAICSLQGEQQAMTSKHMAEVWELKDQLGHMNSQAEKGNMALQQKNQDEKMLTKLFTEVNEAGELLNNYKTDNNELRKEVVALRTSLQQSMVESQVLRDELRKVSSLSANSEQFMDEKIFLLKEMERLKGSLKNMEQARAKLLDRAKRHQMIHQSNQQKMEDELRTLDNMIDTVRKTLSSVPQVVKNCDQLKWLVEYIG